MSSPTLNQTDAKQMLIALDAAIAKDPTPELWNDWATLQCACGELQKAEAGYHNALALDGGDRMSAVNLGLLLFSMGRFQEGLPHLQAHRDTLTAEEKQAISHLAQRLSEPPATARSSEMASAASRVGDAEQVFKARIGDCLRQFSGNVTPGDRYCVIIGASDQSCPAEMADEWLKWRGLSMPAGTGVEVHRQLDISNDEVNPDSIVSALNCRGIAREFDLLVVSEVFAAFHFTRAVLEHYRPRAISAPYNAALGSEDDRVVPYRRNEKWDGTDFFGASAKAYLRLAQNFGYTLAAFNDEGTRVFLVRDDARIESFDDSSQPEFRFGPTFPEDPKKRRYLSSKHYLMKGVKTLASKYGYISYFVNDEYIGGRLESGNYWDEWIVDRMGRLLANTVGVALDIGAHIGTHSIAIAYGAPGLSFVCFEPQLALFRLLERNVFENGLEGRIHPIWSAVGHNSGHTALCPTASDGTSAGKTFEYGEGAPVNLGGIQLGSGGQSCRMLRIDDLDLSPVEYVKMDVEGAEPLVIEGMMGTLESKHPIFLYEEREDRKLRSDSLEGRDKARRTITSVSEFLSSRGYAVQRIGLDRLAIPRSGAQPKSQPQGGMIPRRIFQTWKTRDHLPANFHRWSQTFKSKNPNFSYELWDDLDNLRFIEEQFPWFLDTYRRYPAEIYRADCIRYFYLYLFGGIYADLDTECLRPLEDILGRADVVLARMGPDPEFPHSVPNAIMCSSARQEFWLFVISRIIELSTQKGRPEALTGPVMLKSAVELYSGASISERQERIRSVLRKLRSDQYPAQGPSRVELLGSRSFYPLDWSDPIHQLLRRGVLEGNEFDEKTKALLFPKAWTVTYWAHSWE